MASLTTITAPTLEPVTLQEVKDTLRVEAGEDDTRLYGIIRASRMFAEAFCGLKIMTQVLELTYDRFPASEFPLDIWPLQSIDSIKYDDTASPVVEQTLVENTDYYADIKTKGGRVRTITGWPSVAVKPGPIRIRVTAGHATQPDVPDNIKEGIKAYCVFLYDADELMETVAKSLLWPERIL